MTSSPCLPVVATQTWQWQHQSIRYQQAGTQGVPLLLIHGFGASSDHWRHNLPVLAQKYRVYAIDLLGFGKSAKPHPGKPLAYTFETWTDQVMAFCREVIGEATCLVGNSIGCIVALQMAVTAANLVRGVVLINCSLRMLHDRRRASLPWLQRWSAPLLQQALGFRPFGHLFFSRVARADVIRQILQKAYGNKAAVTQELVDLLLQPALEPGAADVFLAFVRYSQGPLPEELLPQVTRPVLILWGELDPWEPIDRGRTLAQFAAVETFMSLPGLGHCPQDEAPEVVNPILQDWVQTLPDC